jgi:hypothetical protein
MSSTQIDGSAFSMLDHMSVDRSVQMPIHLLSGQRSRVLRRWPSPACRAHRFLTTLADDGHMRSMLLLRLLLIGLGGALGGALIVHGNIVAGALLCTMAVLRLAMVIGMRRRRRVMTASRTARRPMVVEVRTGHS